MKLWSSRVGVARKVVSIAAGFAWLLTALPSHADLLVPAGGTMSLSGGVVDLSCTDVVVGGTLDLGGGRLDNVRSVTIQAGGSIALGTAGTITLAGDWSNNGGSLNPGAGTVYFVDAPACATSSTISGNSNFYQLSIVSTLGKLYRFAAGSSQNVQHQLTMTGTAASPLRIESTVAGQYANINLVVPVQTMAFLAVRDMSATGEWVALGLTNLINGATIRWFGAPVIPTTSTLTLVAMMLALMGLTAHLRRRGARRDTRDTQRTTR